MGEEKRARGKVEAVRTTRRRGRVALFLSGPRPGQLMRGGRAEQEVLRTPLHPISAMSGPVCSSEMPMCDKNPGSWLFCYEQGKSFFALGLQTQLCPLWEHLGPSTKFRLNSNPRSSAILKLQRGPSCLCLGE